MMRQCLPSGDPDKKIPSVITPLIDPSAKKWGWSPNTMEEKQDKNSVSIERKKNKKPNPCRLGLRILN
jgi:hypothetical protein